MSSVRVLSAGVGLLLGLGGAAFPPPTHGAWVNSSVFRGKEGGWRPITLYVAY